MKRVSWQRSWQKKVREREMTRTLIKFQEWFPYSCNGKKEMQEGERRKITGSGGRRVWWTNSVTRCESVKSNSSRKDWTLRTISIFFFHSLSISCFSLSLSISFFFSLFLFPFLSLYSHSSTTSLSQLKEQVVEPGSLITVLPFHFPVTFLNFANQQPVPSNEPTRKKESNGKEKERK